MNRTTPLFLLWRHLKRTSLWLVLLVLRGALVTGSAATVDVTFQLREPGRTTPLPARIHLVGPDAKPVQPPGYPFWHDHFVCPGTAELKLAPGRYEYTVERGPEYASVQGLFHLSAPGEPKLVTVWLPRLADLAKEGWWSGELHVHRAPEDIELLMRAEDLHIAPVITWWNRQNPWSQNPPPSAPWTVFDQTRFYHLMGGEDEREGGALLFFHLPEPMAIQNASREYPSPMKYLREANGHPGVWVDIEKPFWWDAPVWAASGMADSIGLANNHMCRSRMLENEAWGRPRNAGDLPAPRGNGFWTQEIYYHLLNTGLRLPPSAGSASGVLPNPVGYNRVYVKLEQTPLTYKNWWEGLRRGQCFVSNGPLLRIQANGRPPGHVFSMPGPTSLEIKLQGRLDGRDPVSHVEIVKNGVVARRIPCRNNRLSSSDLGSLTFTNSGWFLVRVIADIPQTFRFASTGPFYVENQEGPARRISRQSARFFVEWVRERIERIKLEDPEQMKEVLAEQHLALDFWRGKWQEANAP